MKDLKGKTRTEIFLSRIPANKTITIGDSTMKITSYLKEVKEKVVDMKTYVSGSKIPLRFIAIRVPEHVSDQRIKKAHKERVRKGKSVSIEQTEMSEWTVYVTNIPEEMCGVNEIIVLYKVRWQIELVFKLWKSECGLSESHGRSDYRCLCEFLCKLLGIIIVNWLSLSRCGMLGGVSATKLWRCVKKNVGPIIRAIMSKSVKELAMSL
ncbi:MAG: transposase, partial [Culicoidibacterales bacterium]